MNKLKLIRFTCPNCKSEYKFDAEALKGVNNIECMVCHKNFDSALKTAVSRIEVYNEQIDKIDNFRKNYPHIHLE